MGTQYYAKYTTYGIEVFHQESTFVKKRSIIFEDVKDCECVSFGEAAELYPGIKLQ